MTHVADGVNAFVADLLLIIIVFQGTEVEDTASVSQSAQATRMLSQPHSRDMPPVSWPSCTVSPARQNTVNQSVDGSLLSSPDVLERCVVLSDLSSGASPITDSTCTTPRNTMTPLSAATCDDASDVQETPSSIRSGRKRKRQKKRRHRSSLIDLPVDCSKADLNTTGRSTVARRSNDATIKMEPKMPKLVPEPRVQYNPETPLRISIHLPLNGVLNAAEGGLLNENIDRSEAERRSSDSREMYSGGRSPGADPAMPVDLTSRSSVHVPLPSSASSVADVKQFSFVSSPLPSAGPVYSPISSTSSHSIHGDENASNPGQEMTQPSVGIISSFLNRFSGIPAESLQFSPSQSFWTRSFAEQLAEVNQNSFVATHNLAMPPVLSPVTAVDERATENNCPRIADNAVHPGGHSSFIPISGSTLNNKLRRSTESRDCVAVRPTITADAGLNRVFNVDRTTANQHTGREVDTKLPVLANGECHPSTEAISLNDIASCESDILPGMEF